MAKFIQKGNVIDYTNAGSTAITAGSVVVGTSRIFVAVGDIKAGATGVVEAEGVFEFPAASAAITFGQAVYWDATNGNITATATNNTPAGVAVAAKAAGILTVLVKL